MKHTNSVMESQYSNEAQPLSARSHRWRSPDVMLHVWSWRHATFETHVLQKQGSRLKDRVQNEASEDCERGEGHSDADEQKHECRLNEPNDDVMQQCEGDSPEEGQGNSGDNWEEVENGSLKD